MHARAIFLGATCLAIPSVASGHHVISEVGISPVEPRTSAEIVAEAGRFELGGGGDWQLLAASVEVAVLPRLSLRARLPVARITFDDDHTVTGLGDVELAAKVRLYAPAHGGPILSAGIGTELPTGDVDDGLGGGHVELTPFVAAAHEGELGAGHWIVMGVVSDRIALGGGDDEPASKRTPRHGGVDEGAVHGSPISPHTAHELATSLMGSWVTPHAFVSAGSELIVSFEEDAGDPPLTARLGAGWIASPRVRVIGGVDLPVAGERRFEWKGRLAVSMVW